jgi:hypothetical protein
LVNQFTREADELYPSGVDRQLNNNGKVGKVSLTD